MKGIKGAIVFTAAIQFVAIYGCGSTVPIKAHIAIIDEFAECITNANSHGNCNSSEYKNREYTAGSASINSKDYFNALSELKKPIGSYKALPKSRSDKLTDKEWIKIREKVRVLNDAFDNRYDETPCSDMRTTGANNPDIKETMDTKKTMAIKALDSESNRNIYDLLYYQVTDERETDAGTTNGLATAQTTRTGTPKVEFDARDLGQFVGDLAEVDSNGGMVSLQCSNLERARYVARIATGFIKDGDMPDNRTIAELETRERVDRDISYVREYLEAYFRHWEFVIANVEVEKLMSELKTKAKKELPFLKPDKIDEYAEKWFKEMTGVEYITACPVSAVECTIDLYGRHESQQFVSRAGVDYGFEHVTISIDPLGDRKISTTSINWSQVAADILKVYIEAIGDSMYGVPGLPRSTQCLTAKSMPDKLASMVCWSDEHFAVSSSDFNAVTSHSDRFEALVSGAVGQAVRGVWWASLNNEALAKILETAAGAAAKKYAEKVLFCAYSCRGQDKAVLRGRDIDSLMNNMGQKEIRIRVNP